MKETFYFSHDYNSRNDSKLVEVMMNHGVSGIGIFWCIVEMLYEEGGYLPLRYERITFELRTEKNVVQSIINDYGLFENDGEKFWSNSVIDRLKQRQEKSEKAKQSIQKRWDKVKNTNVLRTNNESNTIKERKGKESKIKENIYISLGEFGKVKIKQDELDSLRIRYDEKVVNDLIDRLDRYIGSKGDKYKSHYLTMINWAKRDGVKEYTKQERKEQEERAKKRESILQEKEELPDIFAIVNTKPKISLSPQEQQRKIQEMKKQYFTK